MSRQPRLLTVNTPYLNGMIEGTEFLVRVEDDRATLSVLEGKVLASNAAGSLKVAPGESATAEAGKAPQLRTVVRPRDAVHWALYYPPVLYFRPDEFPPGPGWQGMVRRSIDFYSKGDLGNALDSIATVPATISDPRFFAYRASLMLAVGRVDEANADIGRALKSKPERQQRPRAASDHRRGAKRKRQSAHCRPESGPGGSQFRHGIDRAFLCTAGQV